MTTPAYTIVPAQFPKACGCGLTHSAEQWAELPLAPRGGVYFVDGRPELELRHCACGSTLAVDVVPVVTVDTGEVLDWCSERLKRGLGVVPADESQMCAALRASLEQVKP